MPSNLHIPLNETHWVGLRWFWLRVSHEVVLKLLAITTDLTCVG